MSRNPLSSHGGQPELRQPSVRQIPWRECVIIRRGLVPTGELGPGRTGGGPPITAFPPPSQHTVSRGPSPMSKNQTHLAIGGFMLVAGIILALTTQNVETPVVSLDKVGIVLIVLGAIEILWTVKVMMTPRRSGELDR